MGTKAFSISSRAKKSLNTLATVPPRNPVAQVGASMSRSTLATSTPLPAGWVDSSSTRLASPARRAGTATSLSSAGFRVMVRIKGTILSRKAA